MKLRMEKDIYTRILEAEFNFQMEFGKKPEVIELDQTEKEELEAWFATFNNPFMSFDKCDKINGMRIIYI